VAHPLDGAFLRVARGEIHIDELNGVIRDFRESNQDKIVSQKQVEAWRLRKNPSKMASDTIYGRVPEDIPLATSLITGEIIYNLRSALDYLVYELARKDSGSEQSGTQFLIEDEKTCQRKTCPPKCLQHGFDVRKGKYLKGLSDPHIDAIEGFQPYKGIDWTKTLRDLSNPDKHRKLTAIAGSWQATGTVGVGPSHSFDQKPGEVLPGTDGIDVYMDLEHTLNVALPDGSLLVETLSDLLAETRKAIQLFTSEF
jgi:hypothetical protein